MRNSKIKMFGRLYVRDMRELAGEIALVLAVTLALDALFCFRFTSAGTVLAPAVMTLGLAAFLPLIASFRILKREWSSNTIYLLMSLPVSGTMVLGAKLAALLTQYVVGTLITGANAYWLLTRMTPQIHSVIATQTDLINRAQWLFVFSILFIALLIATSFLSQLTGRLIPRFGTLTTVAMFLAVLYIMDKLSESYNIAIDKFNTNIALNMPSYGAGLIMTALILMIMAGAVYLYNRRVEI